MYPFRRPTLRRYYRRSHPGLRLVTILMILLGSVPQQLLTLPFWTPPIMAAEQPAPQTATPTTLPPALTTTDNALTAPPAMTYPLPAALKDKPEVTDARTANSATFDMGDGRYALLQETHPLNYQDAKGNWQRIDPTFQAVEGGWINTANTLKTSVAQTNSTAKISLNEAGVGWEPIALQATTANGQTERLATPLPTAKAVAGVRSVDSTTIRYPKSWDNVNLEDQWQLNYGAAAYALQLKQWLPAQPIPPQWLDLTVDLHLKPGTSVQVGGKPVSLPVETTDTLAFVTAQGETLLLQPPLIYETKNFRQRLAGRYVLARTDDPSTIELRVRFAWSWLNDAKRQFPVILDPLFQTTSAVTAKLGLYSTTGVFQNNYFPTTLGIGTFSDGITRALLHFAMPTMPPGTQIDRAYLVAAPYNTIQNDDFYDGGVDAYNLADAGWVTSANAPPQIAGGPLPFFSGNPMRYSAGSALKLPTVWDVSNLAKSWQADPSSNHGILLKMAQECPPLPWPFSQTCNGFYFELPSKFTDEELKLTESVSTQHPDILWMLSGQSGVRLLVFYQGPSLSEGVPQTTVPPSPNSVYYHADHVYNLPPVPNHWQAVAVRGFVTRNNEGTLETILDTTPPLEVRKQGSVTAAQAAATDSKLQTTAATLNKLPVVANAAQFNGIFANPNQLSYAVLNGRNFPGGSYEARVKPVIGGKQFQPENYDVRLVGERSEQINAVLDTATTQTFSFSSLEALALLNVNLPQNANTALDITFTDADFFTANQFDARLFEGNTSRSGAVLASNNRNATKLFMRRVNNVNVLESETFRADATNYGLVVNFNSAYTAANPGPNHTEAHYTVQVRVTACSPGSFPNGNGECEHVDCPVNGFDIVNNFRAVGGFGLWSGSGWQAAGGTQQSVPSLIAPLLGGPNFFSFANNLYDPPHVAAVGGQVSYNGSSVSIGRKPGFTSDPRILLIDCAPGSTTFSNFVDVTHNQMTRQLRPTDNGPVLVASVSGATTFYDPWPAGEYVQNAFLYVDPPAGRFGQFGGLGRKIGPDQTANYVTFNVNWSMDPRGWPSLTSSATKTNGGNAPPVASLNVDIGNDFILDLDPVQLKFVELRGRVARISQPASLGGASKPLQVIIYPSNVILTDPPRTCGYDNCLDLRSTDDTYAKPNRVWQMPDVHLTGAAGLVAVSSAGQIHVFSKDFPAELNHTPSPTLPQSIVQAAAAHAPFSANAPFAPTAQNDFNGNFSYDTFGAHVNISRALCDPSVDTEEVDVIEGATFMTLPNIGDGGDASTYIASTFKLCQSSLRSVHMEFRTAVGIPIGNSGLFLTGLEGTVDLYPSHTTIKFGIDLQAAAGGDGGLVKVHGDVTIDTRGLFAFQGQGSVLKGIVGINGALWVGWSPLDIGFRVQLSFPFKDPWVTGFMRAHLWQGQGFNHRYSWLPDNDETHIAAEIGADVLIRKGAAFSWWFIDIPPDDIHFGIDLAFGQFCTNDGCTTYEWGVKGKFTVVGYDVGLYYTFGHDLDHPEVSPGNLSFILGNDDHKLIDEVNGGTDVPPVRSASLNTPDAPVTIEKAPQIVNGQTLIPINVSAQAKQLLFGLGWQAGTPQLSLINPDGVEINATNAAANNAQFSNSQQSTLIGIQNPKAGQWQAKLANLSENGIEHYQFTYFANHGGPVNAGDNLFLTPAQPDEKGSGSYQITWRVPAGTTANAHISLYTTRATGAITGELDVAVPIVQNLPLKNGAYTWDTSALPFGSYQISGIVDDGVNTAPTTTQSENTCDPNFNPLPTLHAFDPERFAISTIFTATGTVQVNHITPLPPAPTNLTLTPQDGALLARWDPSPDQTVVAYQVSVCNPLCRDTQTIVASAHPAMRINALENGTSYQVFVYAQDVDNRTSVDAALANGTPDANAEPLPSAPVTLTLVSATGATANLSWQPGEGVVPTSYQVVYTTVGHTPIPKVATTNTPNLPLTGLAAGETYKVVVSGVNSAGWVGDTSAPLQFVATSGVDADGDGLPDDWAAKYNVHGANADADGDGLTNKQEFDLGTDPTHQNTDGDSFSDKEEVDAGTDPLDSRSYGAIYTLPRLTLAQDKLVFHTKLQTPSDPAPNATIQWSNTGGGNLVLNAASSANWLTAQVSGNQIVASVNKNLLTPGYHTGVIQVTPAAGSDPLIGASGCVRVQMWASPPDVATAVSGQIWLPLIRRQ
ncbi:MAG: fibronectin type III domain-containing protein [Caldilineaceae bacterium]